jgi:hypothetical protein
MKNNNAEKAGTNAPQSDEVEVTTSSPNIAKPNVSRSQFKPMLFSTPMVQAILDGRKTMPRIIVKNGFDLQNFYNGAKFPIDIADIIWVRETFYAYGRWVKNGLSKNGKQKYKFNDFTLLSNSDFKYKYEDCKPQRIKTGRENEIGWYKRPSLFMPKQACRLFLEVTEIGAEKINSISESDSIKEGVENCIADKETFGCRAQGMRIYRDYLRKDNSLKNYPNNGYGTAKASFETLWYKINGEQSWQSNPFVWVYTFKRVECPQGFC